MAECPRKILTSKKREVVLKPEKGTGHYSKRTLYYNVLQTESFHGNLTYSFFTCPITVLRNDLPRIGSQINLLNLNVFLTGTESGPSII